MIDFSFTNLITDAKVLYRQF